MCRFESHLGDTSISDLSFIERFGTTIVHCASVMHYDRTNLPILPHHAVLSILVSKRVDVIISLFSCALCHFLTIASLSLTSNLLMYLR